MSTALFNQHLLHGDKLKQKAWRVTSKLHLAVLIGTLLATLNSDTLGAFTPSTLQYLVPALSAPALFTPGH